MRLNRTWLAGIVTLGIAAAVSIPATAEKTKIVEIVYDQYNGTWMTMPDGTEMSPGVTPVPTVYVPSGASVRLRVCNTNPLLFDAAVTAASQEDSKLLGSLQSLATVLGNSVAAALVTLGQAKGGGGKAAPPGGPASTLQGDLVKALSAVETAQSDISALLGRLDTYRGRAVNLVQRSEFGLPRDGTDAAHPCGGTGAGEGSECKPELLDEVSGRISALSSSARRLDDLDFRGAAGLMKDVVAAAEFDALDDNGKVAGALASWAKSLVAYGQLPPSPAVRNVVVIARNELQKVSDALADLEKGLEALETSKRELDEVKKGKDPSAIARATAKVREHTEALSIHKKAVKSAQKITDREGLKLLIGSAPRIEEAIAASKAMSTSIDAARKTAGNLVAFSERLEAAKLAKWSIEVTPRNVEAKWDKDLTFVVNVSASSPYLSEIGRNPRLKDVVLTYKVAWKAGTVLGVGVGATYTLLSDPTFAALPMASDPTKKSPQVKSSETRAGQLALLMNWRWVETFWPRTKGWQMKPGIEVGALLNTAKPGVCVGASIEIFKSLRVALGETWQRVMVLDGQDESTVVLSNDDIRTRQAFKGKWYASFSFALDSLSLFKKE